jgi:glycosyltransferase involved in cell wall biosynthesis
LIKPLKSRKQKAENGAAEIDTSFLLSQFVFLPLKKLAFIVSHPIQYHAPLYRLLGRRTDVEIRVFFTWHGGDQDQVDHGFKKKMAWDIPLTEGYQYEVVPNTSHEPGTHHFFGLRNPSLVASVLAWQPDAVHLTGYAYASHLQALRSLPRRGVPVLFRGDSHLLDERRSGPRWLLKRSLLHAVLRWPSAFLYVGQANREYYCAFGVPESKLFYCPHSIEVTRFAEPEERLEQEATAWRKDLDIPEERKVLLFAGKFEDKKRPVALMKAVLDMADNNLVLVMVGDGELGSQVRRIAEDYPQRFRVLPFQNQSRMPLVYRLGDIFVLPSAYDETWGLAVNEALACGRPALVSDKVGCAADLIQPGRNGSVFLAEDWRDFRDQLNGLIRTDWRDRRGSIKMNAARFSPEATEKSLVEALRSVLKT